MMCSAPGAGCSGSYPHFISSLLPFVGIVGCTRSRDNERVVSACSFTELMLPSGHSGEILIVEDPMIQKLIHGILARHGYVTTALSLSKALEYLGHRSGDITL